MMARRLLCRSRQRKPVRHFARVLTDSVGRSPLRSRRRRPEEVFDSAKPTAQRATPMRADPSIDPNAELRDFEPLRVVLALGSLLLALLLSLQ